MPKRESLFVDRPYQLTVIVYANAIAAAALLVLYRAIAYFFQTLGEQSLVKDLATDAPFRVFLEQQQNRLLSFFGGLCVFVGVLVTVGALILSERTATARKARK